MTKRDRGRGGEPDPRARLESRVPVRVRAKSKGLAVEGDRFYVWEETQQEALQRGEKLARTEQGMPDESD